MRAEAVVTRGHGIASGRAGDPRFPGGTIALQLPFLLAGVPGLEAYLGGPPFAGTINLACPGRRVTLLRPEYHLRDVRWTQAFPAEDFHLARAAIHVDGVRHPALLYIPDPATKPDHVQPSDVIELLAGFVPGLHAGKPVLLDYPDDAIAITAMP